MKKMVLKIVLVILSVLNSASAEDLELNLITFASYASEANGVNILIDEELRKENIVFIINDKKSFLFEGFRQALQIKGLVIEKTKGFYVVHKKMLYVEKERYRSIKLNFVKYSDIQNFLSVYENIKFEFIKTSKILLVRSNEKEYKSIKEMLDTIDVLPSQLKLKITIIDTNLDKLKELGSDGSALNLTNNTNFFLNLVSYPFTVKNTIDVSQTKGFYSFLKFLNKNGSSELISNPVLTLSDENETIFNVVNNVPFKTGTVTIDETDTKTTSSYEYKDIGLQISVKPHIYNNKNVFLDLELNVSTILSDSDNLPTTSKKYIKQSFHLPLNELLVLTGINQKEVVKDFNSIPLLSDIPFLGWLFKYESTVINKSNLSIVFELVKK